MREKKFMFLLCSYCDIRQMLYCHFSAALHIVFFDNNLFIMDRN